MPNAVQLLSQVVTGAGSAALEYRWEDLVVAMDEVSSVPLTDEVERLLLAILRFKGQIHLEPTSELPHSMSAEEMLKSFAVQALGKWTGTSYLSEIQGVRISARSPILSAIARKVMQQAVALEHIPQIVSERGMTFLANQRPRRRIPLRRLDLPLQVWSNGGSGTSRPPIHEDPAYETV